MATLDLTKPDPATQNITNFGSSTRTNLQALRDAVIAGNLPGFNYSWSGGTVDQPTYCLRTKGSEIIRSHTTWNANYAPTTIVYAYSSNSGGAYTTIATCTFTWDANGYLTSTTWS